MKKDEKNVLIFGGAGFLGANLVRRCLNDGASVTVVDSLEPMLKGSKESLKAVLGKITFIQGDIRDDKLLKKVIPGQDIIFQCAAQTSHALSIEKPIFDTEVNCIGNLKILAALRDYNKDAVIVYPSSSTMIGKAVNDVIDETHGEKPLDIYSANKGVAEKYYRIFSKVYDLKTVVLRFANLYGPLGRNDPMFGFANYFIQLANADSTVQIFGSGEQSRNVMFVDDAIDAMLTAVSKPELFGEAYFATHPDHYTVREMAEVIVEVFGRGKIKYIPWSDMRKRIEVEKVLFSSARFSSLTGWRPKYSLEEGLKLTKERMAGNY